MSTKESVAVLLAQLQALPDGSPDAPYYVARLLSTLALVLLKEHPERTHVESLVAKALTAALDKTEPHINAMN